jgi:predicted porin
VHSRLLLGLAACLLAGTAAAQDSAPTAGYVRIYGIVDIALSYQSRLVNANGTVPLGHVRAINSSGETGSRLGFMGREDLGSGAAAIFVLESGLQADTGTFSQGGRAFGRQSYVGLEGPWGRLTLGRQYSPNFELQSFSEPFGNTFVGNAANLEQSNSRVDNAVLYQTPTLAGVQAQVLVAPGEGTTAGRQVNAALTYTRSKLYLAASTTQVKASSSGHLELVGGAYDFGVLRVLGHYMRLTDIKPASDAATPAATQAPVPEPGARADSWDVGVVVPFGASRMIASYVSLNDKRAVDRDANQIALAYEYFFSKRTSIYGAAARIVNKNRGVMVVSTPSVQGQGQRQVTLGVVHRF